MGAEVVRHVLEPFFTTRPKGHGTGLGLATVYGIVTQAGGGLNIHSELDLGTTIRIYLPAVDRTAAIGEPPETDEPPSGAGQTIIVAEDEDAIRQVVERILHGAGYQVLTANAGPPALVLLASHRCDLLLTDVVMPEMSGRHLVELAHRREPGLPVLYMSGYSDGLLTDQRLLAGGSTLLQKPFTAAVGTSLSPKDHICGTPREHKAKAKEAIPRRASPMLDRTLVVRKVTRVVPDLELARSAISGDTTSLAVLMERHRAGMQTVALGVLGYGPDAEDAVQDAMLVAMCRIDEVRDPAAVGPWLRTIVRNNCRMRLRRSRSVPMADLEALAPPSGELTPDELLERRAQRDWIWHALGELSEPVRLVTLLRYFSDVTSYAQIAAMCGVPVGTVRSRLSHGRSQLATALRATADLAHDDVAALTEARRREAVETLAAAERGEFERAVRDAWWPGLEAITPDGQRVGGGHGGGMALLIRGMDSDLSHGVRQRIRSVVASRDVMIWEADLISPPDDPQHCPPGVVWLQHLRDGRVRRLRLFHPRADSPAAD